MAGSTAQIAAESAALRADTAADRAAQLERGDHVTFADVAAQHARMAAAADRAVAAALRAAEAATDDATIHERIAGILADRYPDQALRHRRRAARSRHRAEQALIVADTERFFAQQHFRTPLTFNRPN